MALSIKDDDTDALVRKLAARRKLSMTQAIKLAVSNELARDDEVSVADQERRLAVVRGIQARVAKYGPFPSQKEIDDWMYDENGLPH